MSTARRFGCLTRIFAALLLGVAVVYTVAAITSPWSFHIGGRWTPFLTWSGSGKLVTKNGTYPLYITFYPSSHFSPGFTPLAFAPPEACRVMAGCVRLQARWNA